MAERHEEAVAVKVEGGNVDERIRMTNDEVKPLGDNPSDPAKVPTSETEWSQAVKANPARPSEDPGDTTGDDERHPDEPTEPPDQPKGARVRGGEERVEASASESSMSKDCTDATVELRSDADARTDRGDVEGRRQVQGGAENDGGRGSDDSTTNDASDESRRFVLKALAEDKACQRRDRLANESNDLPEPPKPPDDPAQRRTESPSVELEGERRAASSCDVKRIRAQAVAS